MSTLWYPYAQHKTMRPSLKVTNASAVTLTLDTGEQLIDAISSWWAVIHGYSHPDLDRALTTQMQKFSHVMLGGLSHDPAQQLADKLVAISPEGLNHVFFSDSGSVGCEVALKMAVQYWKNKGDVNKTKCISFKKAYHGDTTGVMALSDPEEGMHSLFTGLLHDHFFLEAPSSKYSNDPYCQQTADALKDCLDANHETIAAIIIEPLLQAAGGFNIYSPFFLNICREYSKRYNVLLIFDEVATGFGRTGSLFAANQADVSPDIMVLGKGLTGGYLGLSATLASSEIFDGFYSDNEEHALMHGPTFMGNALGCAVALESIAIFERENYLKKIALIESVLSEELLGFEHEKVAHCRVLGATGVIEVKDPTDLNNVQDYAQSQGVWLRPFGNTLYTMPPYVISEQQCRKVSRVMKESLGSS